MTKEQLDRLSKELLSIFSKEQLDITLHKAGLERLEYYTTADTLPTIIYALLTTLDRQGEPLLRFLVFIRETVGNVQLKAAIEDALGWRKTGGDPYQELAPFGEPFVNRQPLRSNLQQVFGGNRLVLVISGPAGSGKSHSRYLVQHVAEVDGINVAYIRIEGNSVSDLVGELVNVMGLDPKDVHDRLAQLSTVGKGFVSALRGYSQEFKGRGEKWCVILDEYDPAKAAEGVTELVDRLVRDVAAKNLENLWLIVLGNFKQAFSGLWRVIAEDITPLTRPDVERFLQECAKSGKGVPNNSLDTVFAGLTPPLDKPGMESVAGRLREIVGK